SAEHSCMPCVSSSLSAVLLLHARPLLIGGRVDRLVAESLPGLDNAGRLRAGGDLRRCGPAQSEHPPGSRPTVVSFTEPDVHHRVGPWVQHAPAYRALHRGFLVQTAANGLFHPGRPGCPGLGRCSLAPGKERRVKSERDHLLHSSSSSSSSCSRTSSTATIRARDGSRSIKV